MALAPKDQRKPFGRGEILQEPTPKPLSEISSCLNLLKRSWKKKGSIGAILHEWPQIAGNQLASNCQPLSLRRGVLTIGASHPQWRQALLYNRSQLVASLKAKGYEVKELRIQQYNPHSKKIIKENENHIWAHHPSRIDVHGIDICKSCGSPAPAGEMKLWGTCSFCRRQKLA